MIEGYSKYFRYQTLSKATKWIEDGDGVKVRFTNEHSYSPTQLNFDNGINGSLGDLLRTTKGKCLFHADAGHGQVCGPLCSPGVFHAKRTTTAALNSERQRKWE